MIRFGNGVTCQWVKNGSLTTFPGLERHSSNAYPHPEDPHYPVVAYECGYGDDLMAYCREHDFVHSFLADACGELAGSPVLWWEARCALHPYPLNAVREEALVIAFQRWLRANQAPIIAFPGYSWDELKRKAMHYLDTENLAYETATAQETAREPVA